MNAAWLATLLDPRWNFESHCPRAWKMTAWGMAINPHLSEAAGLRQVPTNGDGTTATSTDDHGRYRIAVLPGRGLLLVVEGDGDYRDLDVNAGEMPDPIRFVPPIYSGGKAFAEIDVAPEAAPR